MPTGRQVAPATGVELLAFAGYCGDKANSSGGRAGGRHNKEYIFLESQYNNMRKQLLPDCALRCLKLPTLGLFGCPTGLDHPLTEKPDKI